MSKNEVSVSYNRELSIYAQSSLSNKIKDESYSLLSDIYINCNNFKRISTSSDINIHFICKKCKNVPLLEFISLEKENCTCICQEEDEQKSAYSKLEDSGSCEDNYEDYLKCKIHKNNYLYYCQKCKKDLCSDCLKNSNDHQKHPLFFFDLNILEINQKKEQIDNILAAKNAKQIDSMNQDNEIIIERFRFLLSVIFNDFTYHPNYNHFIIIDRAKKFIDKFILNNNNLISESLDFQKEIKINSRKVLFENKNNPEIIVEIDICKNDLEDLNLLCNMNLINLKKLYLFENNIVNIGPLIKAKFKNLEILNLGGNKLGNENIPYLFKLPFQKLKELNLYLNQFTDFSIFRINNKKIYLI